MRVGAVSLAFTFASFAIACGEKGDRSSKQVPALEDSAGVAIVDYGRNPEPQVAVLRMAEHPIGNKKAMDQHRNGRLTFIAAAATDWQKEIVVANAMPNQIEVLTLDGRYLRTIGAPGEGPGEVRFGSALNLTDSLITVCHGYPSVISRFTRGGIFLSQSAALSVAGRPVQCVGILGDGSWFVVQPAPGLSSGNGIVRDTVEVSLISDSGTVHRLGSFPGKEQFKMTNKSGGQVLADRAFGKLLAIGSGDGMVVLGSEDSFVVNRFDTTGQLRSVLRWQRPLVRVADSMRDEYQHTELDAAGENQDLEDFTRRLLDKMLYPEFLPAYRSLVLSREGDLWVQEYSELKPNGAARWLVFDSSGILRSIVLVPWRFKIQAAMRGQVLASWHDLDDLPHIGVFALVGH